MMMSITSLSFGSMLQDMTLQFDALQTEYKEADIILAQSELNASSRRKCIGRKRDVKLEIRRMEKLMNAISGIQVAFWHLVCNVPNVKDIIFVFGATPRRPEHVYQILYPGVKIAPFASENMARNRSIEVLSRKVIRAFISKGVGTACYTGPSKLYLLVKAPTSFNMPQYFLPKRDFHYSKKIVPFRLQLRTKTSLQETEPSSCLLEADSHDKNHICSDLTWFQCRHVIKGIALSHPTPEE
ncbi:Urease subunit alpha [Bienertia sinuspersici]